MQKYCRLDRFASHEVSVHYCHQEVCLYCCTIDLDSCPINVIVLRALEHPVTMAFVKIFNANSIDLTSHCQSASGFQSVRELVIRRKINLLVKLSQNSVCMLTLIVYFSL